MGVDLNRTDNWTFTNFLTGTSQLYKNQAASTVTIGTSNNFTGTTYINAGVLRISNPYALGAATTPTRAWSLQIQNPAGVRLELTNNITLAEQILLVSRSGGAVGDPCVRNLSGTNTLTGNITVTSGGTIYCLDALVGTKLVISSTWLGYSSFTAGTCYYDFRGDGDIQIANGLVNGGNNTGITNSLYKEGNGTLTLSGLNIYRGPTTVARGMLILNGSINGTNGSMGNGPLGVVYRDVNVYTNGTLRGNGQITTLALTNAGTLAPGLPSSIGALALGNTLTLLSTSTNVFRVSQTGTVTNDQVTGITTVTGLAFDITVLEVVGSVPSPR